MTNKWYYIINLPPISNLLCLLIRNRQRKFIDQYTGSDKYNNGLFIFDSITLSLVSLYIMKKNNYMNSAGSSIMSDRTIRVITDYLHLEQKLGGYECMVEKYPEFSLFYQRTAELINASSVDEIAYTDGGSRGWNALINGLDLSLIDSFITLSSEYLTNIATLQICAKKFGKQLHVIPCDLEGNFDIDTLKELAKGGRACIAISQATAQGSITNPVHDIGEIAKASQSIYLVDATQSIGQIPVDVQAIQCDALTATGRKWLRGPRGTGFVYVRDGAPFSTCSVDGSSSKVYKMEDTVSVEKITTARQFEMWERNYGLMLGLSNAIQEYMDFGVENVHRKIRESADKIRTAIASNDILRLVGKSDSESGIIGIIAKSNAIHEEMVSQFKESDITVNQVYEWACPLFFDNETRVIRLAAHHDVDLEHIDKVAKVLGSIGRADMA